MITRPRARVTGIAERVAVARQAFRVDAGYLVEMCEAAAGAEDGLEISQVRKDLKVAETHARALCVAASTSFCAVESPCGTGNCPYAKGEMAGVRIKAPYKSERLRGPNMRPVRSHWEHYRLSDAVGPLLEQRRVQLSGFKC